jgi:shikimate dehydrogenase
MNRKLSLGLLGKDISHTKSPEMYKKILEEDFDYKLFDIASPILIPNLDKIFEVIDGLSITAPYKKHFINNCKISNAVKEIGAINCIKKHDDQYWGTNTDYEATGEIVRELLKSSPKQVVVLGSGSMAKMLDVVFHDCCVFYKQICRQKDGPMENLDLKTIAPENSLVINACARGFNFSGKVDQNSTFWDMNYSHQHNKSYLKDKCNYIDGLNLLYRQAYHAALFWGLDTKELQSSL